MSQYFKTILKPNEAYLYKEKKSKFYGHAFPLPNKEVFEEKIALLKEQYSNANHFCYAWQIGVNQPIYKLNDDGEPNNTGVYPSMDRYNHLNSPMLLLWWYEFLGA